MTHTRQTSTIPRYYAIWRTLWSRIVSGHYPAGSLIGTEAALADEFSVSRVTLREALALLEQEGLVVRRRSFGTFVAENVVPRGVVEFTGYLEDIILQADSAETTYFSRRRVKATKRVADALRLPSGSTVHAFRRLRTASGQPKLWLVDYLPEDIALAVSDEDAWHGSLLSVLDGKYRISWGHQSITARIGTAEVCERLAIPRGDVVLHSDRTMYDAQSRPLSYVEMYYPGSRFSFDIRLGRIT